VSPDPAPIQQHIALLAYEAAAEPQRWPAVLQAVQSMVGASAAMLFTPGEPDTHERLLWAAHGIDPQAQAEYGRSWSTRDPWLLAVRRGVRPARGAILIGESYLPQAELRRTDFYNEYAQRHGIERMAALVVEDERALGGMPFTVLSLMRAPGTAPFEPAELAGLQALHPHLYRALRMHWALASRHDRLAAVEQSVEAVPQPLLVLASTGKVKFANGHGRELLSRGGVADIRHGSLLGIGRLPGEALAGALRAATQGVAGLLTTWWEERGALCPAVLHVVPLPHDSVYREFWPRAAALLLVEAPGNPTHAAARLEAAVQHYRLSPAESRVLACAQRGLTPTEIAEQLGVRLSTVRAQLSSLFQKTGTRRQAELMRLVG
jgi:DNA-binding CsgD family transcriptional regulator